MANGQLKVLDIERISERLFEQVPVRERICREYCIKDVGGPEDMAYGLVESIGQVRPSAGGTHAVESNQTVFRAAALAIASNMRSWSRFLGCRRTFKSLLRQYDPVAFARDAETDPSLVRSVEDCLGGRTKRADAKAIVKWARILAREPRYFSALSELKNDMEAKVHEGEIVPVLATFLGSPSKKAENRWHRPPTGVESWKAPGMGMVLACEFLRNLHEDGFKPDRHIKRLMGRWFSDVIETQSGRASDLACKMLDCRSREVIVGLKISLAGMAVTPQGCSFTKADNLVWALGAYVEKKNSESGEVYWKTAAA